MGRTSVDSKKTKSTRKARRTRTSVKRRQPAKSSIKGAVNVESRESTPRPSSGNFLGYDLDNDGPSKKPTDNRSYPQGEVISSASSPSISQTLTRLTAGRLFRTTTNDFFILAGRRMPVKPPPVTSYWSIRTNAFDIKRDLKRGAGVLAPLSEDTPVKSLTPAPTPAVKTEPPGEPLLDNRVSSGGSPTPSIDLFGAPTIDVRSDGTPNSEVPTRENSLEPQAEAEIDTLGHWSNLLHPDARRNLKITKSFIEWEITRQPPPGEELLRAPTPLILSRLPSFDFGDALPSYPQGYERVYQGNDANSAASSLHYRASTPQVFSRQSSLNPFGQ